LVSVRRIVFATQKLDAGHRNLASIVGLVDELSRRVSEVAVIADAGTLEGRPDNVTLRTFGAPRRAARLARFVGAVRAELASGADALVAHQIPVYAIAAAPFARGVPILLWYSHWKPHLPLRLSERVCAAVLSADSRSFPLHSGKVRAIGQAVDLSLFPPAPLHGQPGRLRVLALGRYSEAKGLPTIVESVAAARAAGEDVTLVLRGTASPGAEERHKAYLAELVGRLGIEEHVDLGGPVPHAELSGLFAGVDVLVNNMRAGAADRVGYEAAASCLPILASNPIYDELVAGIEPALLFARERAEELTGRLAAIAALSPEERRRIGSTLRERVEQRHSVRSWVDGLLAAVEEAARQ
jgi:glycosyltransferase involved in cell wall biosynthesis